jgi:hypothetical protein
MKFHLNPILKFWTEIERENCRKWLPESNAEAIAQILKTWEAEGNAMRYVNRRGLICWKATPKFLDQLCDRKRDAFEESKDW